MATSASSGFVDNWQAEKTVTECNLRMLQEEDSCDVTFRCGDEGHVVKAHRYMLISRSCVFHAMLTGAMAEKSDVKIPDIEPLVFKKFLLFIYTDNTDINVDNVTALLYTARKYGVTGMENKCTDFLEKNLNPYNACGILEAAHRFDQKELYEKTLTLIKFQGEKSLQSPCFLALSQVLVDEIVGSDDLEADEHVIFTAVNDWSEAEVVRYGRKVTPESKRSALGGILKKVRFPLMKPKFLADCVKKSGLLTAEERLMCMDLVVGPEEKSSTFIDVQRRSIATTLSRRYSKCRFSRTNLINDMEGEFYVYEGSVDATMFSSNSNLFILGYQLYGAYGYTYPVTSYFGDEDNVLNCVVQERTEYTCKDEMFDVIFSRPVSVTAGEWYTLAVKIEVSDTSIDILVGNYGQDRVVCDDGVELQFRESSHSENWTVSNGGQIPSLIYSKL